MKTINLKLFGTLVLLLCAFTSQTVFATILIKKDSGPGTAPNALISNKLKISSLQTQSILPVTADIINGELGVFFSSSVGIATVSVVDEYGNIIEVVTIDTNTNSELYILTDGYESGIYTLKISYGTTRLIGGFEL